MMPRLCVTPAVSPKVQGECVSSNVPLFKKDVMQVLNCAAQRWMMLTGFIAQTVYRQPVLLF